MRKQQAINYSLLHKIIVIISVVLKLLFILSATVSSSSQIHHLSAITKFAFYKFFIKV